MELAEARSTLIALAHVQTAYVDLVLTTNAHVLAIPARIVPELIGETSHAIIQAKIEEACKEALSRLARSGTDQPGPPVNSPGC
jgi:hypothetical protein